MAGRTEDGISLDELRAVLRLRNVAVFLSGSCSLWLGLTRRVIALPDADAGWICIQDWNNVFQPGGGNVYPFDFVVHINLGLGSDRLNTVSWEQLSD